MRRLWIFVIVWLVVFIGTTAALAQEETPSPATPEDIAALVEQAIDAAERAEEAAQAAEEAAEEGANAFDVASNMFGLFEAMSAAVGFGIPLLAILAGLIGFRRLESAQSELREARERFEEDVQRKEAQLDTLREELERSMAEQRAVAGKASLALALLPLGERQYRAQDYTGALDTYQRALNLDKDNPIIHYRIGYVHTQSGELDAAKNYLSKSLELDPDFAPSLAALGYVYRRQGDKLDAGIDRDLVYNHAEENFLKALQSSPKLMDEDNESWWGALGGLYRRRGQIEQAIYAYEQGAKVTPHSSYPYSNLALLYMQSNQRRKALEAYRRVEKLAWNEVRADVDNYWAYADLVVSRLALGKYQEVVEILDTTLDTAPVESPYTLESLISTLSRLAEAYNTPADETAHQEINKVIQQIQTFKTKRDTREVDSLTH